MNYALCFLGAFSLLAALLILKAQLRCRHCQVKDQTIGAQAGVAAAMGKEIEHLKGLLDRALVKQGGIDPIRTAPVAVPEDPGVAAEKAQVEKAIKSGGEAYGVDE